MRWDRTFLTGIIHSMSDSSNQLSRDKLSENVKIHSNCKEERDAQEKNRRVVSTERSI